MMYIYAQDMTDSTEIKKFFNLDSTDTKYSKELGGEVFDFVGFVVENNKLLTVFPKHFMSEMHLLQLNKNNNQSDYIKLLFDVIQNYLSRKHSKAAAKRYIGPEIGFESDYPFASFFKIYDYFVKYGLYREKNVNVSPTGTGKIDWKKTLQKSNAIISGEGIVFSPLYKNKNLYDDVFITQCMVHAIDSTLSEFPFFLSLPKTGSRLDKLNNDHSEYILKKLYQIQKRTFKDSTKRLVENLIDFFFQLNELPIGGRRHLKIRYFDRIWEDMVLKYLNRNFLSVVGDNIQWIPNPHLQSPAVKFAEKEYVFDKSSNNFKIRIDHFAEDTNCVYIFDSKYYDKIETFNYKQFSYNEIVRGLIVDNISIYSAIILPFEFEKSKKHFELNDSFLGNKKTGNIIIEQYLSMFKVMKEYLY